MHKELVQETFAPMHVTKIAWFDWSLAF